MCRIIWITLFLLSASAVYADEQGDGAEGAVKVIEGHETREQLDLKQANQSKGLSFAVIGFDSGNPNCTYTAGPGVVQSAIDAGFEEIRLVRGTHSANIEVFDQSINIKGKYTTCVAAQLDLPSDQPADISILSGVTGAALPVVRISGNTQRNTVLFKNLTISNGEPVPASIIVGGGIDVRQADVSLTFDTVQVTNNQGNLGGGLAVSGSSINVFMVDSLVVANNAQEGGGIHCFGNGAAISMRDTGPEEPSGIALNNATNGNGGGLYIWGSCDFTSTSGSYGALARGGLDLNGILLNSATGHGGGVYVSSNSEVDLDGSRTCGAVFCNGNNDSNVRVTANVADSDDDNDGSGGGIYATGLNTQVDLTNAIIADNTALNGGGLAAVDKAGIFMSSYYTSEFPPTLGEKCWSPGSCSQITGNEAKGLGGGAEIRSGSYMFLDRTVIKQNRANNATALFVHSESGSSDISVLDLVGSLVVNNGAGGMGGFNDANAVTLTRGQAFIQYSTFADNDVEGSVIGSGNGLLNIRSSIVHQTDGVPTYLAFSPNILSTVGCLMVSTLDDFSGFVGPLLSVDDPEFVDRLAGDFHLSDNSSAIDYCNPISSGLPPKDLDEDTRGWDDPAAPNPSVRTFDLGYDENFRLIADLIFKDGFE